MTYRKTVITHLERYKKENHKNIPNGIYRGNSREHIFQKNLQENNLLEIYRSDLIKSELYNTQKLHTYFNHLNSSQAMCFNFFYPLYHERKLELVLNFLGMPNERVNYESVCFEKDGIDGDYSKKRRPTSFDFYLKTETEKEIFFEIKYTESGFGKAKDDDEHKLKFAEIYSKYLHSLNSNFHPRKIFFENYQICRNLIHISENSYVVFLHPSNNKSICKAAKKAQTEIVIDKYSNHFHSLTWEALLEFVMKKVQDKKLSTQFIEFSKKYITE